MDIIKLSKIYESGQWRNCAVYNGDIEPSNINEGHNFNGKDPLMLSLRKDEDDDEDDDDEEDEEDKDEEEDEDEDDDEDDED